MPQPESSRGGGNDHLAIRKERLRIAYPSQ